MGDKVDKKRVRIEEGESGSKKGDQEERRRIRIEEGGG